MLRSTIPSNIKSGIYRIKNSAGFFYIGASSNLRNRVSGHRTKLATGRHSNPYLQNKFNKEKDGWVIELVEVVVPELLLEREQVYLDLYCGTEYNLNFNKIAGKPPGTKGRRHSPETKAKIAAAAKGRQLTEEHKIAIRKSLIGRVFTAETRLNMSKGQQGKKLSEVTKQKLREINLGRHHTPETIAKIKASKGK